MNLFKITTSQLNSWQLNICKFIVPFLFSALATPVYCVELTIYTENWPPISFKNGDKVDGMAVEVVDALQKKMGTNSAIQLVPWARGYKAVLEDPNVLLFTVGRSAEREKLMTLLGPVAVSKTVLYTRKGNAKRLLSLGDKIYNIPVGA
ncbi:ABC-type amino acid transport substrate-binding protein, partial [Undibacterium sp. GrIS 1.2]|uniref:substrate-binding periplasmic protein n=1 Tax=Undibacterium sp. GrIS 1.2 TaxID=3143933 RepID=UPI003393EF14